MRSPVMLFLYGVLLSGCVFTRLDHTPFNGVKRDLPLFCTGEKPTFARIPATKTGKHFEAETENYNIFRLNFSDGYGEAEYFQSKIPGAKKVVLVLPIYGKHEIPAEWFSQYITVYNPEADFNVVYLQEQNEEDPLDLDNFLRPAGNWALLETSIKNSLLKFHRILGRISHALDWIEQEKSADAKKIAIIGFSTSALAASMAMSVDHRIAAGAIVLGGGNIHQTFALAEEKRIRQIRETTIANSHKNLDDLTLSIRRIFGDSDPTCLAQFVDPSKILFVDSHFDEFIPSPGREDYWRALGRPERITFFAGHKTSFLSLTPVLNFYLDKKILEFFRKHP